MEPPLTRQTHSVINNRWLIWGLYVLLQLLVIGAAFLTGFLFKEWFFPADVQQVQAASEQDLIVLRKAQQILRDNAYDPLPAQRELEYGMIRGMLAAVNDPYTGFYSPPQAELHTNQLQGHYGGIGVRLDRDADNWVYLYPYPDSSALKAGIFEGDRLLAVDLLPITQQTTFEEVQAAIRGPVDEIVKITVGRKPDYQKALVFSVKRADVSLPSVTWNLAPNEERVGVVQVTVIAQTTPDEVKKAILDLQNRGASHFILDLRNNGGGLVDAGVKTAGLFLPAGPVIEEQYRGQAVRTYSVEKPGLFIDLPLVVLVNHGTASAAEILAGALQGQKRAQLVGSPTYGKDSIQLVFDLGDGSSLHVTAARWWVPNLEPPIKGNGLQPNVLAEDTGMNPALQKAIEVLLEKVTP